jgi:hypothetical protein
MVYLVALSEAKTFVIVESCGKIKKKLRLTNCESQVNKQKAIVG